MRRPPDPRRAAAPGEGGERSMSLAGDSGSIPLAGNATGDAGQTLLVAVGDDLVNVTPLIDLAIASDTTIVDAAARVIVVPDTLAAPDTPGGYRLTNAVVTHRPGGRSATTYKLTNAGLELQIRGGQ